MRWGWGCSPKSSPGEPELLQNAGMNAHEEIDRSELAPVLREVLERAEKLGIKLGPTWPADMTDEQFLEHQQRDLKKPYPAR